MTPRMSIIGAAIRKIFAGGIGGSGDYYWDKVVLAMSMNNAYDSNWSKTSALLHMDEADPYWSSTVLAMHMDDDPYWSNVVLAMHMDGADSGTVFTDVKGKTCTAKGNAQTKTATKKFGTASGYFDGTGDAVLVTNSSDFVFGTGDFTIELWIYPTNNTIGVAQDCLFYGNDGNNTDCWFVRYYGGGGSLPGQMSVAIYEGASTESFPSPGAFVYPNQWNHIVVVRKSGQKYQIINGKKAISATSIRNHGMPVGTPALAIGREYHDTYGSAYFTGYIDDIRITKGIGRYDSSFYPPQRAFTDGLIVDEKGKTITLVGNASLLTTQKKFGVSSLYFDGTGDYLTIPDSVDWDFGNTFTVEMWVNFSSLPTTGNQYAFYQRWDGGNNKRSSNFCLLNLGGVCNLYGAVNTDGLASGSITTYAPWTPSLNVWHHVAFVHTGASINVYANGTLVSATPTTASVFATDISLVIAALWGNDGGWFHGYIDDLRITKGVARYTSNFVPRPAAFRDPITSPTFLDEKGNQFLAFGTPSLTATNAKFGGMSASFNGTTDYLRALPTAEFAFAAGDFTVEAWVRTGASGTVIDLRSYSSELGLFAINSGKASIWNRGSHLLGTTDLTTSTWFHLAWVRKAGVISLYVNGKVEAISATDGDFGISTRPCTIGADFAGANFFSGLIDDVRITKGVARYTGEFTPTNYAFRDPVNNPMFVEETGKSVTAYGNVVTTTPLKFGDAAASFDGTGDYLTVPDSTDLRVGATSPFTVEFWVRFSALPADFTQYNLVQKGYAGASNIEWQIILVHNTGVMSFGIVTSVDGTSVANTNTVFTPSLGSWYHLALVRDETNLKLYKDGIQIISVAGTSLFQGSGALSVGGNPVGANPFNGSIDDLRITKGLARYLSNFTPPSKIEPYQKTHNTDPYFNNIVLGMHMDGTDTGTSFPELTGKAVSVFGNAQTKTAIKMFGTASAYFDGTGDYLTVPNSSVGSYGTADFTFEGWFYFTTVAPAYQELFGHDKAAGLSAGLFCLLAGSEMCFNMSTTGSTFVGGVNTSGANVPVNTWVHLAWVRYSGSLLMFMNGKLLLSTPSTFAGTPYYDTNQLIGIGASPNVSSQQFLNGYADDIRITKGVARYTANFQPVQAPFPDFVSPLDVQVSDPYWEQVVLGMHMDGADSGTTFTDVKGKSITVVGNTQTKTAIKKLGTASGYFDGVGDYLTSPTSADFSFGSGDFTVEAWVYALSIPTTSNIFRFIASCDNITVSRGWSLAITEVTGAISFTLWTSNSVNKFVSDVVAFPVARWTHVAASRVGNSLRLYKNGALVGTTDVTGATGQNGNINLCIGNMYSSSVPSAVNDHMFHGYLDDLRITKGVGRYSANFQPPGVFPEKYTESDGYWSSTNLAMHFDGADNGTVFTEQKGLTVTRYGSIYTKTAQKKFGTASVQFTGSQEDCFRVPASANWDYAGTSFTIEFWLYPTAYNASGSRLINSVGATTGNWSLGGINWFVGVSSSQVFIQWHDGTTVRSGAGNISLNQWSHVAICGDGSQVRFFVNGVLTSISTIGQYLASREAAPNMCIGSDYPVTNTTYGTTGYMDDLQLIKGQCRYKANFAVPTRAFNNG